jgi:hypothetical protein
VKTTAEFLQIVCPGVVESVMSGQGFQLQRRCSEWNHRLVALLTVVYGFKKGNKIPNVEATWRFFFACPSLIRAHDVHMLRGPALLVDWGRALG